MWGGVTKKVMKSQAKDDKDAIDDSKKILSELKKHTMKIMDKHSC